MKNDRVREAESERERERWRECVRNMKNVAPYQMASGNVTKLCADGAAEAEAAAPATARISGMILYVGCDYYY